MVQGFKNRRSCRGFATVYTVIILSSLLVFLLTALEAAGGYAASSMCEDLTVIAGRSVLSEFHPELYSRYGVFALRNYGDDLHTLAEFYIDEGLPRKGIVKCGAEEIFVDPGPYAGLNTEVFSRQIIRLGWLCAAGCVWDEAGLTASYSAVASRSADDSISAGSFLKELTELETYSDAQYDADGNCTRSESATARETRRQACELLSRYRSAMDYDGDAGTQRENVQLGESLRSDLPSALLGMKSLTPLLSGGLASAGKDAFAENAYIVTRCSDQLQRREDSYLGCETEYVLYGKNSDKKNAAAARLGIFGIRYSANMIAIYGDPASLERIGTLAAAFYLIPYPLAVFMLASAEAGTEAKRQVGELCSGGTVPLSDTIGSDVRRYQDYLALMLFALDEDVKMARLMDVMELNLQLKSDSNFAFCNYCYGFDIRVDYVKLGYFSGMTGIMNRRKRIETAFVYK